MKKPVFNHFFEPPLQHTDSHPSIRIGGPVDCIGGPVDQTNHQRPIIEIIAITNSLISLMTGTLNNQRK